MVSVDDDKDDMRMRAIAQLALARESGGDVDDAVRVAYMAGVERYKIVELGGVPMRQVLANLGQQPCLQAPDARIHSEARVSTRSAGALEGDVVAHLLERPGGFAAIGSGEGLVGRTHIREGSSAMADTRFTSPPQDVAEERPDKATNNPPPDASREGCAGRGRRLARPHGDSRRGRDRPRPDFLRSRVSFR